MTTSVRVTVGLYANWKVKVVTRAYVGDLSAGTGKWETQKPQFVLPGGDVYFTIHDHLMITRISEGPLTKRQVSERDKQIAATKAANDADDPPMTASVSSTGGSN